MTQPQGSGRVRTKVARTLLGMPEYSIAILVSACSRTHGETMSPTLEASVRQTMQTSPQTDTA